MYLRIITSIVVNTLCAGTLVSLKPQAVINRDIAAGCRIRYDNQRRYHSAAGDGVVYNTALCAGGGSINKVYIAAVEKQNAALCCCFVWLVSITIVAGNRLSVKIKCDGILCCALINNSNLGIISKRYITQQLDCITRLDICYRVIQRVIVRIADGRDMCAARGRARSSPCRQRRRRKQTN